VESPADRFVAALIGVPAMNTILLPVEHCRVSLGKVSFSAPEADRLFVGLRPEDLRLTASTTAALALQGLVERVELGGTRSVVTVEVGGHALRALVESREAPRPGTGTTLFVDPARLMFFTADEEGRRISWNADEKTDPVPEPRLAAAPADVKTAAA
jgi:ABC-type sugar transport system ATPase subunit